ncbi:MAG TPA: hypothetical protein VM491_16440 [Burkholderiaceae bacterium]|nr:hypothetical protein [Burkholderiaceae bacterium]
MFKTLRSDHLRIRAIVMSAAMHHAAMIATPANAQRVEHYSPIDPATEPAARDRPRARPPVVIVEPRQSTDAFGAGIGSPAGNSQRDRSPPMPQGPYAEGAPPDPPAFAPYGPLMLHGPLAPYLPYGPPLVLHPRYPLRPPYPPHVLVPPGPPMRPPTWHSLLPPPQRDHGHERCRSGSGGCR